MANQQDQQFGISPRMAGVLSGVNTVAQSRQSGRPTGALPFLLNMFVASQNQKIANQQAQFENQRQFAVMENQARQRLFQESQQRFDAPVAVKAPPGAVLGRRTPSGGIERLPTTPSGVAFQEGQLSFQKQLTARRAQTGERRAQAGEIRSQQEEVRKQIKFQQEQREPGKATRRISRDVVSLAKSFDDLGFFKGPVMGRVRDVGRLFPPTFNTVGVRGTQKFEGMGKIFLFSIGQ